MSKPADKIGSVDRACWLLRELAQMGAATLSDLAAALETSTSTVDRLLATLSEHGFVERSGDAWHVGKQLAAIWAVYQTRMIKVLTEARRNLAETAAPVTITHVESIPEDWNG